MRSLLLPALAGLLLVSGCASDTATDPVAPPQVQTPAELHSSPPGCPSPSAIRAQITALFPRGVKLAAGQAFSLVIQVAVQKGKTDFARQVMFAFLKYALYEYQRAGLIGGTSAATQAKLLTLTSSFYCYVGLPPLPTIDPDALGTDFGIGIVDPNSPTTIISTGSTNAKSAGVLIPEGAAPTTTVITITRLPDAPGPLNTNLDQYPAFYQFSASPDVTFDLDVTVGVCQVQALYPFVSSRLRLAHNVGEEGLEILPFADAGFLQNPGGTCDPFNLGMLNTPGGLFRYALNGAGRVASYVLLPEVAHAAIVGQCCLGGSTKSFSPFGAVDTLPRSTPDLPCSAEDGLQSDNSEFATSINFKNLSGEPVRVEWIDFEGDRVFYNELDDGTEYLQYTYLTHPWIITGVTSGRCYGIWLPTADSRTVVIQ